jgi:hypothetical protein
MKEYIDNKSTVTVEVSQWYTILKLWSALRKLNAIWSSDVVVNTCQHKIGGRNRMVWLFFLLLYLRSNLTSMWASLPGSFIPFIVSTACLASAKVWNLTILTVSAQQIFSTLVRIEKIEPLPPALRTSLQGLLDSCRYYRSDVTEKAS